MQKNPQTFELFKLANGIAEWKSVQNSVIQFTQGYLFLQVNWCKHKYAEIHLEIAHVHLGFIQFNYTAYKGLVLKGALLKLVLFVACLFTCSLIYDLFVCLFTN